MKKVIAIQTCGTLSQTSKMACASFGLPTSTCKVGGKLRNIPGSACYGCYADRGFYALYPTVAQSQQTRLALLEQALADDTGAAGRFWIDAIKAQIKQEYFRWHDSGDLISERHLSLIVQIAIEMPHVRFWLPTKEKGLILAFARKYAIPENLTIRLSAAMLDQRAPDCGFPTSSIARHAAPIGFACPAPQQGGQCLDCRACWSKSVTNVSYKFH